MSTCWLAAWRILASACRRGREPDLVPGAGRQPAVLCVDSAAPPLRLPMGTDTLKVIADKHAFVEAEVKAWKSLAASTDFPKEALTA
jgi:hypothetical protein